MLGLPLFFMIHSLSLLLGRSDIILRTFPNEVLSVFPEPYEGILDLQDRSLILWRNKGRSEGEWSQKELEKSEGALWHVSWSLCGSTLAVSGDDNKVKECVGRRECSLC